MTNFATISIPVIKVAVPKTSFRLLSENLLKMTNTIRKVVALATSLQLRAFRILRIGVSLDFGTDLF